MSIPTFREFLGKRSGNESRDFLYKKNLEYLDTYYPESEAKPLIWHREIRSVPKEETIKFNPPQIREYNNSLVQINSALTNGRLNLMNLEGSVLDFGFGYGGSLALLARFSDNLVGVEADVQKCWQARKMTYLSRKPKKIIFGDGIDYMEKRKNSFDLITAFCLGDYDTPTAEIEKFILASHGALKSQGRVVITSDPLTMENIQTLMQKGGSEVPTSIYLDKD